MKPHIGNLQVMFRAAFPHCVINWIVFEDQNAFQGCLPSCSLTPSLHLRQRGKFVMSLFRLLFLQTLQPTHCWFCARYLHAGWKRIDEEADHGVSLSQIGWPSRSGHAENDVVLSTVPTEQERPGTLNQSVEG